MNALFSLPECLTVFLVNAHIVCRGLECDPVLLLQFLQLNLDTLVWSSLL